MQNDKPMSVENGWQQLHTEVSYKHRMFDLRNDLVKLPNGKEHYFTYVKKPPGVFILPVTHENELVLIRQFRYVVDLWLWEIPAGGSDDFDGDEYTGLAKRELHEEIGGHSEEIIPLGPIWGAAGVLDQVLQVYLALGVNLDRENHPEDTEVIEVKAFPIKQALHILRKGPTDALAGYIALRHEDLLLSIADGTFDPDNIPVY